MSNERLPLILSNFLSLIFLLTRCSNLGNKNSDSGHIDCLLKPCLDPGAPRSPLDLKCGSNKNQIYWPIIKMHSMDDRTNDSWLPFQ